MVPENLNSTPRGVAHPAVLDALAHDTRRDTLVLAMYENRPWLGEEPHLVQLQEKLNAYASFILDGELADTFPHLASKPVEIQLRTRHHPDPLALGLLQQAGEQLALQQITLETILVDEEPPGDHACACGSTCS
jgi:hypothetical protein